MTTPLPCQASLQSLRAAVRVVQISFGVVSGECTAATPCGQALDVLAQHALCDGANQCQGPLQLQRPTFCRADSRLSSTKTKLMTPSPLSVTIALKLLGCLQWTLTMVRLLCSDHCSAGEILSLHSSDAAPGCRQCLNVNPNSNSLCMLSALPCYRQRLHSY